jgi:hypothetical protein
MRGDSGITYLLAMVLLLAFVWGIWLIFWGLAPK